MAKSHKRHSNPAEDEEQQQQAVHADKEYLMEEAEGPVSVNDESDPAELSFAAAEQPKAPKGKETEEETPDIDRLTAAERVRLGGKLHDKPSRRKKYRGRAMPMPRQARDPKKDKQPIEPEDMGLPEENFLLDRKVRPIDLKFHAKLQRENFIGSNVRRIREFALMFDKGPSTKMHPKLDLSYNISENPERRKDVIAKQLLRNLHSRQPYERRNAQKTLKSMDIDKELFEDLKKDKKAYQKDEYVEQLQDKVPNL